MHMRNGDLSCQSTFIMSRADRKQRSTQIYDHQPPPSTPMITLAHNQTTAPAHNQTTAHQVMAQHPPRLRPSHEPNNPTRRNEHRPRNRHLLPAERRRKRSASGNRKPASWSSTSISYATSSGTLGRGSWLGVGNRRVIASESSEIGRAWVEREMVMCTYDF